MKASWAVLRQDKELLLLPIISGLCAIAVMVSFAFPVISIIVAANENALPGEVNYPPLALVIAFIGYLLVTFVGMFFNSALIHAANQRMEGGDPTLGSALAGAWSRVAKILAWAMVAATVSIIIAQLQERFGLIGRLLGFLAGTAWTVVTFLVLPVIIIEDQEPIESAKRSAQLLRRSWGEGLAGHISLGVINFLVAGFAIGIILLGLLINPALIVLTGPVALLAIVISFIVMSALSTVFQTALYRHAAELPTGGFDANLMLNAFTHKKGHNVARPSKPSDIRRHQRNAALHQAEQPTPPSALDGPQDWSKLPDEWK